MKVIVLTCNRYNDIAQAWLYCRQRFWADCRYPIEILANSERLDAGVPVHYIKGKDLAYGWRMRRFLESYDESLILVSMIDYLIRSSDQTRIAQAEALCQATNQHIVTVRLRPMPHPADPFEVDGFGIINKSDRRAYPLSLQPGIWRTDVLYDLLRDDEDPWDTEIKGSYRAARHPGTFLSTTDHALPHVNYYNKGRVSKRTREWVRENVPAEYWPRAAREG